jgi:hypothetical protein
MITADTLNQIAIAQQTTTLNIAREYAQHLFLSGFYQQRGTERVLFRGDTALRLVYHSPRFSEDLDFSGYGVCIAEIEDWIATASASNKPGLPFQLRKASERAEAIWKFWIWNSVGIAYEFFARLPCDARMASKGAAY